MDVNIREIKRSEYKLLDDFLYEAIFIPEGAEAPPREIIDTPELQVYVQDFGTREGDLCLVAEVDGNVGYGIVDENDEEYIMVCEL